jgi:enamine deaminase RidA (YjgF/YER057c/UK114 family)
MKLVATNNAPAAIGPYSQAVKTGNLVFLSGQLGVDPATKKHKPARSTVQVAKLPLDALIEIECVAVIECAINCATTNAP